MYRNERTFIPAENSECLVDVDYEVARLQQVVDDLEWERQDAYFAREQLAVMKQAQLNGTRFIPTF